MGDPERNTSTGAEPSDGASSTDDRTRAQPATPLADDVISRFERTVAGRVLMVGMLAVIMSVMVVDNMPNSQIKRQLAIATAKPALHLGLRQDWALFAPNPPQTQSVLFVQVEYSDGSLAEWELPTWGGLLGSYDEYRWRKWGEAVLRFQDDERLRQSALAIGRFSKREGLEVTRVALWRIRKQVGDGIDKTIGSKRMVVVAVEASS